MGAQQVAKTECQRFGRKIGTDRDEQGIVAGDRSHDLWESGLIDRQRDEMR